MFEIQVTDFVSLCVCAAVHQTLQINTGNFKASSPWRQTIISLKIIRSLRTCHTKKEKKKTADEIKIKST